MAVFRLESQDPCNGIPKTASLRLQPKGGFTRLTAAASDGDCIRSWRRRREAQGGERAETRLPLPFYVEDARARRARWLPDPRSPQLAHFPNDPVEEPFAKTFYFT